MGKPKTLTIISILFVLTMVWGLFGCGETISNFGAGIPDPNGGGGGVVTHPTSQPGGGGGGGGSATATPAPSATATVFRVPHGIAVSPSNLVVVAESGSNSVAIFSPGATAVSKRVTVESGPEWVAVSNTSAYVTNFGSGSISIINLGTGTLDRNVDLPDGTLPVGIAINTTFTNVYVADSANARIIEVNTSTFVTRIIDMPSTTINPGYLVFNPGSGGGELHITTDKNQIVVLNAATGTAATFSPVLTNVNSPQDIDINSSNSLIAVSNSGSSSVIVYNPLNGLANFPATDVGAGPFGIDISVDNDFAYVANRTENSISQVNLATGVTDDFAITGGTLNSPYDITSGSSDPNFIYVTNSGGNTVYRINVATGAIETITTL